MGLYKAIEKVARGIPPLNKKLIDTAISEILALLPKEIKDYGHKDCKWDTLSYQEGYNTALKDVRQRLMEE